MGAQVVRRGLGDELDVGVWYHEGLHAFTPYGVRGTDCRSSVKVLMFRQRVYDCRRMDILIVRDDHVFDPVDDEQVTALAEVPGVAGVHPAVAYDLVGLDRSFPVARHDVITAGGYLADVTRTGGDERSGSPLWDLRRVGCRSR